MKQLQSSINSLNFGNATSGAGRLGSAAGGMRLDRLGSQMQWLGRQIEYNFTLPLALAGAAAGKFALDNEAAFTRITKVYGDAAHGAQFYHAELQSLQKAFIALSNEFGISQADTLNIAADWAAAGASGLALAKSVQLTMKTMVLGEMDATTATQSLMAIQAQYGQTIGELSDTIDVLNMVENQTGISMQGLIDGFARTAGVARASGVSVRELAADLAALTPATGSAANAGNALKTIFSRLLSPTKDSAEVMKLMGVNTLAFSWQSATAQQRLLLMAGSFEKLSDAQKGFVSSIIASRYQVNRFEVLMKELTSSNGYYQKALQSTSDKVAIYKQAQSELNAVLTSNPQRLKEIWTTLQNAAANIVQPLIPLVLYLAQLIENLVTAFSNLNPAVQKFVLFGLAMIAAMGPIIRYLGAFQVLIYEFAKALKFVIIPFQILIYLTRTLVIAPLQLFFNAASILVRGFFLVTANVLRFVPALWSVMYTAISFIVTRGSIIIMGLYKLFLASMGNMTVFFSRVMSGTWAVMMLIWDDIIVAGMTNLGALFVTGFRGLQDILVAFAAFAGNFWRFMAVAPLATMRGLFTAIIAGFSGIIPALRVVGVAIFDAMTGPWGIAITIIVTLLLVFWKDIKQMWQNGVNFFRSSGAAAANAFAPLGKAAIAVKNLVIRAFNALPQGIQNAMIAVVKTIEAAAKAVYQWFSYINPWARHSPSLVDNVTSGVAEIIAQFGKLTGIGSTYVQAASDLAKFAAATKAVNRSVEDNKYAEIRKDLVNLASSAVAPFDRLIKELRILEDQLDSVKGSLDAEQAIVDNFKSQLDNANDALSAQKDILDAMKESADNYSNTLAQINGDIETLQGTQTALRQAGAGSEILAPLQAQLDQLKQQKKGINDQLTAAQKAYNDQKKLVEDLTAARDKLQASYDLEQQKLKAIQDAYDKINQRIQDITKSIDDFASSADALKKAGKVDATAAGFNAGAGANFADVGGSGGIGREGGIADQSSAIDDFTKQIQDETKKMYGMFNFLDPIKKAWGKAWAWVKTTFGPILAYIGQFLSHLFDGIPNPAAKLDFSGWIAGLKSLFNGFLGFFHDMWSAIGPPLKELGKVFIDTWNKAVKELGPQLAQFKDLWGPLQKLWQELVPVLKVLGAIFGGTLLLAIMILVRVLAGALGPVLRFIIDIIAAVIQVFRGLIEFIVGVFTGNWSLAWKGVVDIFEGVGLAIWSLIKNAALLIWGVVKGLVEAIVDFFIWMYDELVGHSIIPDLVNSIVDWFTKMANWVKGIWNDFMAGLAWIWHNILEPIFNAIKAAFKAVGDGISATVDYIKARWDDLKNTAVAVFNAVKGFIDDFVSKVTGIKNRISNAFGGIFDGLKDAFKDAVNWIIDKWNNLSFGFGSFSVGTPNIPKLAAGGKTSGVAIVGEGDPRYPEYVIPTDPAYRKRAWQLFSDLGNQLGVNSMFAGANVLNKVTQQLAGRSVPGDKVQFFASGGVLGNARIRAAGRGGVVVIAPRGGDTYHFHGDLSFPNVKKGGDAEEFVKNLRALAGA